MCGYGTFCCERCAFTVYSRIEKPPRQSTEAAKSVGLRRRPYGAGKDVWLMCHVSCLLATPVHVPRPAQAKAQNWRTTGAGANAARHAVNGGTAEAAKQAKPIVGVVLGGGPKPCLIGGSCERAALAAEDRWDRCSTNLAGSSPTGRAAPMFNQTSALWTSVTRPTTCKSGSSAFSKPSR